METLSLEKEKISKLLIKFSTPAIVGMLVNALYGAVDTMFVGKFVNAKALAGVGFTFPVTNIIMAFGMLVGIGGAARISIALGAKRKKRAEKVLGNALILMLIISLLISVLGVFLAGPVMKFFGASGEVEEYALVFVRIMLAGSVFQIVGLGLNNVIRSSGSPKIAMVTMIIGGVINIILDYIFIVPFKMGVAGAAYATIIAQAVSCIWVLLYFFGKNSLLKIKASNLKLSYPIVMSIVSIGMAPFFLQVAASIIQVILNKQITDYSSQNYNAVSAMAIISRIAIILLMPIFGINQGAQPIIGYNYGAKQYDRVKEALKLAIIASTIICVLDFAIIQLFPAKLLGLFTDLENDKEVVIIGTNAIRIYCLGFSLIGFQIIASSFFQSIGKAGMSMVLSLSRQVGLLIPLLLIMPIFFGLSGIWVSAPISDFLAFSISIFMIRKELKNLDKMKMRTV